MRNVNFYYFILNILIQCLALCRFWVSSRYVCGSYRLRCSCLWMQTIMFCQQSTKGLLHCVSNFWYYFIDWPSSNFVFDYFSYQLTMTLYQTIFRGEIRKVVYYHYLTMPKSLFYRSEVRKRFKRTSQIDSSIRLL